MRVISLLIISKLKKSNDKIDTKVISELNEKYKELSKDVKNELDINLSSLIDIFINSLKDAKNLVDKKDQSENLYSNFKKLVIENINELRKNLKLLNLDAVIRLNESFNLIMESNFNNVKFFLNSSIFSITSLLKHEYNFAL